MTTIRFSYDWKTGDDDWLSLTQRVARSAASCCGYWGHWVVQARACAVTPSVADKCHSSHNTWESKRVPRTVRRCVNRPRKSTGYWCGNIDMTRRRRRRMLTMVSGCSIHLKALRTPKSVATNSVATRRLPPPPPCDFGRRGFIPRPERIGDLIDIHRRMCISSPPSICHDESLSRNMSHDANDTRHPFSFSRSRYNELLRG